MNSFMTKVLEELPERLTLLRVPLPDLLEQTVDLMISEDKANGTCLKSPVYTELLDFLATEPTLEQIANFKASQPIQDRVEQLLDKNRESSLTALEWSEMNTYRRINHIMILFKARARILALNDAGSPPATKIIQG